MRVAEFDFHMENRFLRVFNAEVLAYTRISRFLITNLLLFFSLSLFSHRAFLSSTSRQNLETIVEAIRHLEGDSMFDSAASGTSSSSGPSSSNSCSSSSSSSSNGTTSSSCTTSSSNQEVPLALTKRNSQQQQTLLQVDMNQYIRFHSRQHTQTGNANSAVNTTAEQQQRPGVIVVKQT